MPFRTFLETYTNNYILQKIISKKLYTDDLYDVSIPKIRIHKRIGVSNDKSINVEGRIY